MGNKPIALSRNMFDAEHPSVRFSPGEVSGLCIDFGRGSVHLLLRKAELAALYAQIGAALTETAA